MNEEELSVERTPTGFVVYVELYDSGQLVKRDVHYLVLQPLEMKGETKELQ